MAGSASARSCGNLHNLAIRDRDDSCTALDLKGAIARDPAHLPVDASLAGRDAHLPTGELRRTLVALERRATGLDRLGLLGMGSLIGLQQCTTINLTPLELAELRDSLLELRAL